MASAAVVLYVPNPEQSAAFFRHVFGETPMPESKLDGSKQVEVNGMTIAFRDARLNGTIWTGGLRTSSPGKFPIGAELRFDVDDIEDLYARAIARGAEPPPKRLPFTESEPSYLHKRFLEPGGILVHLIQTSPPDDWPSKLAGRLRANGPVLG